jgi:hypothetical protein
MPRLRFLNTLSVACALLCASTLLVVQHGYACSWRAALTNYRTQETTLLRLEPPSVEIPVLEVEKGIEVHCRIERSDFLSVGVFQRTKADVLCDYPDGHILTARAIHIFDNSTGEQILYPVMLFFSHTRYAHETLYRLYVDCQ